MSSEKELSRINDGKMARLLLSNLSPILEQVKVEAESRFLSQFKEGKLDQGNSLAYAAIIGTIEDIKNKLSAKINTADRVVIERQHERNTDDIPF